MHFYTQRINKCLHWLQSVPDNLKANTLQWATDESLLSQAPLNLLPNQDLTFVLPCLSLHHPVLARILLSWFSQNPSFWSSDPLQYLIEFLILHHPPGMTFLPGLPSWGILLNRCIQNPLYPWWLLSVIFHPPIPLPCSLAINSHFPLLYWVEPSLSCLPQNLIGIVPLE